MRRALPAVIWSLILPGAGQVYNRQWPKALVYGGLSIILSLVVLGSAASSLGPLMDQMQTTLLDGGDPTVMAGQLLGRLGPAGFWLMVTMVVYVAAAVDAGVTAIRKGPNA